MRFALVFFIFLSSCTQYEQQPELKDALFNKIQTENGGLEKELAAKVEECKKILNEAEASKPQTGLRAKIFSQWKDCNLKRSSLEQNLKYGQVQLESRRVAVAAEYSEAIKNGRKWPAVSEESVPHGTNH